MKPSRDIVASHCKLSTRTNAIKLGTESFGGFENISISDCQISNTQMAGIALYEVDGADLRDVTIKNVSAKNIGMIGMLINGVPGHPVEALALENIQMELPGGGTLEAAKVQLPERESAYPEYDTFGKTMPAYAVYARHVRGIKLLNVRTSLLKPYARPATVFIDVEGVTPAAFAAESSKHK